MLQIRKKSAKVWLHIDTESSNFILSKFYCKTDGNTFKLVEQGGSQRKEYLYTDIEVYDDTASGSAEVFASSLALMQRLEELQYVGFTNDGEVIIANLISTDASNNIVLGTDGKLYSHVDGSTTPPLPSNDGKTYGIKDGAWSEIVASSSSGKRTFICQWQINQSIPASASWYRQDPQVGIRGNFTTNASLTPTNAFANNTVLTPAYTLPFQAKIKSVTVYGWSNQGATPVRFCINSSKISTVGGVTTPVDCLLLADFSVNTQNIQYNGFRYETTTGLNTTTLPALTELRNFFNNNNVSSNIYDGLVTAEFEEVI